MYAIVDRVFRYSHLGVYGLVVRMSICSQVYIDVSRSLKSLDGIFVYF